MCNQFHIFMILLFKFKIRFVYFQFVFPSRVVSAEALLSAYVYFPTTRRLESDRRGGRDLREGGGGGEGGEESKGGRSRKTADYPARLGTRYCSNKILKNNVSFKQIYMNIEQAVGLLKWR